MNGRTTITLAALAAVTAITAAGCALPAQASHNISSPPATAPAAQSQSPAPQPSPNGTYTGSCDYTLSVNPYRNDHLIGEIDLVNTGNIGTIDKVVITWPQEGYPPIRATRTVHLAYGQRLAVRFHISAGSTASNSQVIPLLQSWQQNHDYRDGCTYKTTETATFGTAH